MPNKSGVLPQVYLMSVMKFVSLPYFSAVPVTEEQSSLVEPVRLPRRKWKIDWKLLIMAISAVMTCGILVVNVLRYLLEINYG